MGTSSSYRSRFDPEEPAYDPDLFKGSAQTYARYRVPYPPQLLDDLRGRAGVSGQGRLLDLGSGPGRVAVALAPHFKEVWAVDQEPEMIAVGRELGEALGFENLHWLIARAEDLDAPRGAFELITIGEAFHRFDRPLIARQALTWLKRGGHLATMGCFGITRGSEDWQVTLRNVVKPWAVPANRVAAKTKAANAHESAATARGKYHDERVLESTGFVDVRSYEFLYHYEWTLESIIGNLYSTSGYSRRALGDRTTEFERAIEKALLAHDGSGRYEETMRFAYTLARRPNA